MQLASLLSMKVILWQGILGFIQFLGVKVGEKTGLGIAYVIVLVWTVTKTYNNLLVLQIIVQTIIAFLLYSNMIKES